MRVHTYGGVHGEFHRYRGSRRVTARIGQPLLKDSIGDFAGFPVELAQLLEVLLTHHAELCLTLAIRN